MPLISVIVPIYNVELFLRECVDSLLNQESDDYEIILVDDGSPDNCPSICDEYAAKNEKVKVVHKSNGGLVSARKAGVEKATGEYIANVDGDDWVTKDFISSLSYIIKKYNPDVVHFYDVKVSNGQIEERRGKYRSGLYDIKMLREQIYSVLIEDKLGIGFDSSVCDNVFRKDIYIKVQLSIDDSIQIGEDTVCTKSILTQIESLYILDKCLSYYRINAMSMTKRKKPFSLQYPANVGQALEKLIDTKQCDFQEQIYRYVTHNLFVACASAFYAEEPYSVVKERIRVCLDNEYYKRAIEKCNYDRKYIKGNMARIALKYRLFGLMKLYNRLEKKK